MTSSIEAELDTKTVVLVESGFIGISGAAFVPAPKKIPPHFGEARPAELSAVTRSPLTERITCRFKQLFTDYPAHRAECKLL